MKFRMSHLFFFTGLVAIFVTFGLPLIHEYNRPTESNYVVAASDQPGVNGFKIIDSRQRVRLLVLEKLTQVANGRRGRNSEPSWLKYEMTFGRRISIRIDDKLVYFGGNVPVYYAVDGGPPSLLTVPLDSINPNEFPHITWDNLVEKELIERSLSR